MQPAILFSMAGFALASSITPGPVNLVALNSGLRFGGRATLPHVTGATIGFTLLLALIGLGLAGMLEALPAARNVIAWSGALFILWQAVRLWLAPGLDDTEGAMPQPPLALQGALMQWLNPKAWMASMAGMSLYGGSGWGQTALFVALYFVICWGALSCWGFAGGWLRHSQRMPQRLMRHLNRVMAVLLAGCALSIPLLP
jgi:threonine/homoserine/homoserine lactone efflux protein